MPPLDDVNTTWSGRTPATSSWSSSSRNAAAYPSAPIAVLPPIGMAYGRSPSAKSCSVDGLPLDLQLTPVALGGSGEVQLGTEQRRQQLVAGGGRGAVTGEHEVHLETESSTGSSGHPTVVRLRRADRDERLRAAGDGVTAEELELARLVATATETGEVVALDPQPRPAVEHRTRLQRRGEGGERRSFEMIEHDHHARQ